MAVRSKEDVQAFRDAARCLFFSNATVDEFLATATAAQMRAVLEFIGMESGNRAAAKHAKHLQKLKADGKLHGFTKGLQSARLVILDEFGYVPIDIEGSRLLYQVVTECMKGSSMIITTNIEFGKWGTVLGDDKMAAAIVDRLVEHERLVEFTGASHRMEHALMLGNRAS